MSCGATSAARAGLAVSARSILLLAGALPPQVARPGESVANTCRTGGVAENSMKRVLVGFLLGLSAFAAGCQSALPTYNYSCDNYRAIDAGLCDDPNSGRLFGAVVGGGFQQ